MGQIVPQVPQFFASVFVSVHVPEQAVCPPPQLQAPVLQDCPVAHVVVQLPQCVLSICVSTQAPLQLVDVPWHTQALPKHFIPVPHLVPQVPQFAAFVVRAAQMPAQSTSPAVVQVAATPPLPPAPPEAELLPPTPPVFVLGWPQSMTPKPARARIRESTTRLVMLRPPEPQGLYYNFSIAQVRMPNAQSRRRNVAIGPGRSGDNLRCSIFRLPYKNEGEPVKNCFHTGCPGYASNLNSVLSCIDCDRAGFVVSNEP